MTKRDEIEITMYRMGAIFRDLTIAVTNCADDNTLYELIGDVEDACFDFVQLLEPTKKEYIRQMEQERDGVMVSRKSLDGLMERLNQNIAILDNHFYELGEMGDE